MKFKNTITYLIVIIANLGISFLLNLVIFKDDTSNFIMVACGFILLVVIVDYIICQKFGYNFDLFTFDNSTDNRFILLNNIFIGCLFSVPLAMFATLLF